jgi:hypothetical protein
MHFARGDVSDYIVLSKPITASVVALKSDPAAEMFKDQLPREF